MEKEIREYTFSATDRDDVDVIVSELAELAGAAAYKEFGAHGVIEEVKVDNYAEKNAKVKSAILGFAANKAGLSTPATATELAFAMDNQIFKSVMNTINAKAIGEMMSRYESPQLDRLVSVDTVEAGSSQTYEIETKALPIAQRATYGSNVTMVPTYVRDSITITPKAYSLGISLDFIRILANGYDWGKAVARVYAGMVFAQYKLAVSKIFDTNILNGTPLYSASFTSTGYTQLASDVGMLNGGNSESVIALGTRVAWNSISALATQGGFSTKDEYIRNAYLQKIYGVDSLILDQFTNLAAPFTNANAAQLRAIPDNLIVLVPSNGDKIVKLVRESYVRVIETPATDNNLNRLEYSYFQQFDAGLVTASYFGLQSTQA